MNKEKLAKFKETLLKERRDIFEEIQVHMDGKLDANLQGDLADLAEVQISNEVLHALSDFDKEKISDIDRALQKLEDGTYGICEGTGKKIKEARLNHIPWTRYSMEYAQILEQERN